MDLTSDEFECNYSIYCGRPVENSPELMPLIVPLTNMFMKACEITLRSRVQQEKMIPLYSFLTLPKKEQERTNEFGKAGLSPN